MLKTSQLDFFDAPAIVPDFFCPEFHRSLSPLNLLIKSVNVRQQIIKVLPAFSADWSPDFPADGQHLKNLGEFPEATPDRTFGPHSRDYEYAVKTTGLSQSEFSMKRDIVHSR